MAFITEEQPQPIIAHWVSWRHLLTTEEVVIKGGAIRVYGKGRPSTLYRVTALKEEQMLLNLFTWGRKYVAANVLSIMKP